MKVTRRSPLYPTDEEEIKWGLKMWRDFWEVNPTLGINLCLIKCPQSSITAKFSITVTNEKENKLLFKKISSPVPFAIFSGELDLNLPAFLSIGNREDLLEIPSNLIHVEMEYEK